MESVMESQGVPRVPLTYDYDEGVAAQIEEFTSLNRRKQYDEAKQLFDSDLTQHLKCYPVMYEYADHLLARGAFEELRKFVDEVVVQLQDDKELCVFILIGAIERAYVSQSFADAIVQASVIWESHGDGLYHPIDLVELQILQLLVRVATLTHRYKGEVPARTQLFTQKMQEANWEYLVTCFSTLIELGHFWEAQQVFQCLVEVQSAGWCKPLLHRYLQAAGKIESRDRTLETAVASILQTYLQSLEGTGDVRAWKWNPELANVVLGRHAPQLACGNKIVRQAIEEVIGFPLPLHKREACLESLANRIDPLCEAVENRQTTLVLELIGESISDHAEARDQTSALHIAASSGQIAIIEVLIKAGADLHSKDLLGRTPLHKAAANGHDEVVELLIQRRAETDSEDWFGKTALQYAIEGGHSGTIDLLLGDRATRLANTERVAIAFNTAAQSGYKDVMQTLIRVYGMHSDPIKTSKLTPLMIAAREGHLQIVKLLVGSLTPDEIMRTDEYQWNAHMEAEHRERTEIVEILLEAGKGSSLKSPNIKGSTLNKDERGAEMLLVHSIRKGLWGASLLLLRNRSLQTDFQDDRRRTLLSYAVGGFGHFGSNPNQPVIGNSSQVGIVKMLLDRRDVLADARDDLGRNVLSYAVTGNNLDVVKLLLRRDDVVVDSRDRHGASPLLYACIECLYAPIMQLLLEQGKAQADMTTNHGRMPISYAIERKKWDMVLILLQIDSVNRHFNLEEYKTLLFLLAEDEGNSSSRQLEIMELILSTRSDLLNCKDDRGRTPLFVAAANGQTKAVEMLLSQAEIEVNIKDKRLRSPISYAAEEGTASVVKLLLGRSDLSAHSKDSENWTPFAYAVRSKKWEAAMILAAREDIDIQFRDLGLCTPLILATKEGQLETVQVILNRHDSRPNVQDMRGRTPLSYAAQTGKASLVELLLSQGEIRADAADIRGRTPLSHAAGSLKAAEALRILVARSDVRLDSTDFDDNTPLSYARKAGLPKNVEVLEEAYAERKMEAR